MNGKRVLFITRKYPPMKGGMESYSYNLISNYDGEFKAITLGKKQIHLIWFLPYCFLYTFFNCRKYEVMQLGDMLLCGIGWFAKKINPSMKVVATVHGLDITYSNPLYRLYLRMFSKGLDYYVPNSSYTEQIALKNGYFPCTVIPPATLSGGVTPKETCKRDDFLRRYNIDEDAFVICTVGRLVKRKGVEWFIRNVLSGLNQDKIVYLVVGSGEMEEEIRKAVEETKATKVKLLGRVSEQQLNDIYAHSNVFLMPNIYVDNDVEGYGMVAVEAAAAGCLVVASKMQGITDAVRDGVSGVFYEPENADNLKELLNHIIEHYSEYKQITITARDYVMSECTGTAIAEKYKNLIENTLYM